MDALRKIVSKTIYSFASDRTIYQLHKNRVIGRTRQWSDMPFYFIHIPKSGGKSIVAALDKADPGHILFEDLPFKLRNSLSEKPCFAVVRDPVSRIQSTFKFAHKHIQENRNRIFKNVVKQNDINIFVNEQLNEKLRDSHHFFRPSSVFINSARDSGALVEIIDFKKINEDVNEFTKKHGYDFERLPSINVSAQNKAIQSSLNDESIMKIKDLYHDDMLLYQSLKV